MSVESFHLPNWEVVNKDQNRKLVQTKMTRWQILLFLFIKLMSLTLFYLKFCFCFKLLATALRLRSSKFLASHSIHSDGILLHFLPNKIDDVFLLIYYFQNKLIGFKQWKYFIIWILCLFVFFLQFLVDLEMICLVSFFPLALSLSRLLINSFETKPKKKKESKRKYFDKFVSFSLFSFWMFYIVNWIDKLC